MYDNYFIYILTLVSLYRVNYDPNGTLCKSRIFLVAKLFLASLCLVRDPNHQSNDRCWRVRKSLIFAKRKYRLISYIQAQCVEFLLEGAFFFPLSNVSTIYLSKHSYTMNYNTMIVPKFKYFFENDWNIKQNHLKNDDHTFPIK